MFRPTLSLLSLVGWYLPCLLALPTTNLEEYAHYEPVDGDIVEHQYVVYFHDGHNIGLHAQHTGVDFSTRETFVSMDWLPGYVAKLNNTELHELVRRDPGVRLVENDVNVRLDQDLVVSDDSGAVDHNRTGGHKLTKRGYNQVKVTPSTPNLVMSAAGQKLSQPIGSGYDLIRYLNPLSYSGYGTRVYILDTGIRITHDQFQGRAEHFRGQTNSPYVNQPVSDQNGHGTHVAGIVGAYRYGIAPGVQLVNVKVLNDQSIGQQAQIANAINDVVTEHNTNKGKNDPKFRGSVINMSLSFPDPIQAVRDAIAAAISAGVPVVAAAGNKNVDAAKTYPCAIADVICVGAVDFNYQKYTGSNFGSVLDVLAPGVQIQSLDYQSDRTYRTLTGTSMAAPHIAGMAAIWTSWEALRSSPSIIKQRLTDNSLSGITSGFNSATPNVFGTTGINHPNKPALEPYVGAGAQPANGITVNSGATTSTESGAPLPTAIDGGVEAPQSITGGTTSGGTLPNPLKVMIVGDSITHGHDGDYTWRYRLWQWFRNSAPGLGVDFVGPYRGTFPMEDPSPPQPPRLASESAPASPVRATGRYAADIASSFDSDHFAVWGRQVAQDKSLIRAQVQNYQPDLILVLLGFNDMGWFVSDDQGTLDSMKIFVDEARAAKSDVRIAIGNVPQRTRISGRDDLIYNTAKYNTNLPGAIFQWSTPQSQIELVDMAGNYSCGPDSCPSGYDGLHPNAVGEYQIARAFSTTLYNRYGIGSGPLAIPSNVPARGVPVPNNIVASGAVMGVTVTWDAVYGARSYDVRSRIQGAGEWTDSSTQTNRFDTTLTVAGITWEYQIRTSGGDTVKGDWSGIVSALSRRDTAPPPERAATYSTIDGMRVEWNVVSGWDIDRYEVITWDRDTPGAFIMSQGYTSSPAVIKGLIAGHKYDVWVGTWAFINGRSAGGLPGSANPVKPGYPSSLPGLPSNLVAENLSPTNVRLTWTGIEAAAAYEIWVQNINNSSDVLKRDRSTLTSDTTKDYGPYLYPGTWNYRICIAAVNGQVESDPSKCCVVPPRYPGY